jgi:hypothetical protein
MGWVEVDRVGIEVTPVSWGSSSKSNGRAVVGDSGLELFPPADALLGVL